MRAVPDSRRQGVIAVLGFVLVLILAGCTTASGGVQGKLSRALDECSSATATVRLTLKQLDEQKATSALSAATVENMLTEITKARDSTAELSASSARERSQRGTTLGLMNSAVAAVLGARDAISAKDPKARRVAEKGLDTATRKMSALSGKLEGAS